MTGSVLGENGPLNRHIERATSDINTPVVRLLDGNVVNDNIVGVIADGDAISTHISYTDPLYDNIVRVVIAGNPESSTGQGDLRIWSREPVNRNKRAFYYELTGEQNSAAHIEDHGAIAV